ncbi:MAG: hypothetical protein AUK35_07215 [Zetaproteobacteria bacterium CG2_30_46_52]|nr:MAG: hypothetical protein AUK35_07215 [Zetaproteobacteria bacterium CG2_30_46_52]
MNHMQALQRAEAQSRKAEAELTKIVRGNITRLERDLRNQTDGVLSGFQKSLRSTLQRAHSDYTKAMKRKQLLLWMPFLLNCLLLGVTMTWAQQKLEALSILSALTTYQTMTYQGQSYVSVSPTNVLKTQDGQYLIRVK